MVMLRDSRTFADLSGEKRGPSVLIACDPSLHSTGFALFLFGELTSTWSVKVPATVTGDEAEARLLTEVGADFAGRSGFAPAVSVIEDPRLPPIPGKSNHRSMSSVAYSFGVCCGAMRRAFGPSLHTFGVATWKARYGLWPQGDRKTRAARALRLASHFWPKHKFKTSDEVDAALLGEYALADHWLSTIKGVLS